MPRRPPIDPFGMYHLGTRGVYGQPLFRTREEHELFLHLYGRVAGKYGWITYEWVLMLNHHHFVVRLTNGGLSEGMRELHGGYSRRIHAIYGLTNQGHLVRHGFFARELESEADIVGTCRYIDLNTWRARGQHPARAPWCGYAATIGSAHPRPFHSPHALLELISAQPARRASLTARLSSRAWSPRAVARRQTTVRSTPPLARRVVESHP